MDILYYSLPFIMAITNRIRGADFYLWKIPMHTTIKIILPVLLAFIACMNTPEPVRFISVAVIMVVAYRIGELWGWGKWMGTILERHSFFEDNQDGDGEGRKSGVWFIANLFINEKKHFINHCRLALAIRGIYWWLPVLAVFYMVNVITWQEMVVSALVLGISFPVSCEIARWYSRTNEYYNGYNLTHRWRFTSFVGNSWELSEVIYGWIHGTVFFVLMMP